MVNIGGIVTETVTSAGNTELTETGAASASGTSSFVSLKTNTFARKAYLILKRGFDIIASFILVLILLVPMLIIAIIIRLDSKGPALFRQERLGKGGKPFTMLKFRTMHIDAEKDGPKWADPEDMRCTKLGRALRRSRLDELPQLFNIFIGNMSFVGPRPERKCFYEEFDKYIPEFKNRLAVTPGLTGLAQVNGGYELKPEEKIVYDEYYIAHMSIKMDITCMVKTFRLLFTHEGAR